MAEQATEAKGGANRPTLLVVDDVPQNLSLMSDVLDELYSLKFATSGARALKIVHTTPPDLILLDIMMPEMDGYEVCRLLKADPTTRDIPVIFVTAMAEVGDEEAGLNLGAVDYITKPINPAIVRARVRNHLTLRKQMQQQEQWNAQLAERVRQGVAEVERLGRLRRFFSPAVADLLLAGRADDPLQTRRRDIVVVFLDLRGYTAFTETHEPDEVMKVLGEYHAAMGELIMAHGGTLERFTGDGMMIFFNDPIEIDDPAGEALRMAAEMQARFDALCDEWKKRGYSLQMGIGMAQGVATIGAIGFEGRRDYGAIGGVTNLAARLCGEAKGRQVLVSETVARDPAQAGAWRAQLRPVEPLALKGFAQPVPAFELASG